MNRKPFVLYAEDDPDDQQDMIELLGELYSQAALHVFNNGLELFDYLRTAGPGDQRPFCIFLDVNMPVWDGLRTLKELKSTVYQHIPVIMWSTSALPKDKDLSLALGAKAFITKPVQHSEWVVAKHQLMELFTNIRMDGSHQSPLPQ